MTGYGAVAEALGFVLIAVGAAFSGRELLAGIVELAKFFAAVDDARSEDDSLRFILGNIGVPLEVLQNPLPDMDLKKILDDYGVFDVDISRLPWLQGLNIPVLEKKQC